MPNNIINYKVRANFAVRRMVFEEVKSMLFPARYSFVRPKAYTDPVVEYSTLDGKRELTINNVDLHILSDMNKEDGKNYILNIIGSMNKDPDAGNFIKDHYLNFYKENRPIFEKMRLIENDHIVNSNTSNTYSEAMVSNKGVNLISLSQERYPVPDFSILTSKVFSLDESLRNDTILNAINNLEKLTGKIFGADSEDPLLSALRFAMPLYLPGFMPTFLNAGLTEDIMPKISELYGKKASEEIFLSSFKNLFEQLDPKNKEIFKQNKKDMSNDDLINYLYDSIKAKDPQLLKDPYYQTIFFVKRAYKYYEDRLDLLRNFMKKETHYPSLILQEMVFPVIDESSYAGVLYSRHPRTGYGKLLEITRGHFGEAIMTGGEERILISFNHSEEIKNDFGSASHFAKLLPLLEDKFRAPVTIEFASTSGSLALLQANPSELTGIGAINSVIDLFEKGTINKGRVIELIRPYHVGQIIAPKVDRTSLADLKVFCNGVSVLPRTAVSGKICFSIKKALEYKKMGYKVILVKDSFDPGEMDTIRSVDGIISLDDFAIHIVTFCETLAIPALIGVGREGVGIKGGKLKNKTNGIIIKEGDDVTISSQQKCLLLGQAQYEKPRLLRLIKGEKVEDFKDEGERKFYELTAKNFIKYEKIIKTSGVDNIHSTKELYSVCREQDKNKNEMRAKKIANEWYENKSDEYINEIFTSGLGDHHNQTYVFDKLTIANKIDFFKKAVQKCEQENKHGNNAGSFMLGRFLDPKYPVSFWKSFTPKEKIILLNEWVLAQKYSDLQGKFGERSTKLLNEAIRMNLMDELNIHTGNVMELIPLKLSCPDWNEMERSISGLIDPQVKEVIEILKKPYERFYDYDKIWSISKLKEICEENDIPLPKSKDI